ncbi:helix-turn-helix domain-containing protein [Halovulum marinum]|nr:helix-turn-helix transcriptional regulator [Halovulum marinum]
MSEADHTAAEQDYSDQAATFGDRIVAAREMMGMNQAQLARRLGIKTQTLQNWEEDRAEPRANKLQMLAGVLNVSIVWLMSGEGPGVSVRDDGAAPPDLRDIVAELRELRALQTDLANRTLRLERRLIGLLRE